jgi:hypothetical protein
MSLPEKINSLFRAPPLTRVRRVLAMTVAIAADGLQIALGGLGWFGLDQAIDLVAMLVICRLIGFHILLLPTFVVELVPLVEDLPTWTACTAAVLVLRKRGRQTPPSAPAPPPPPADKPVIDV